ncbi:1,4-alpha-glucan branching protein GlgB [Coralloluteibacterium stylophorae]|uniref:1,4-alpha-glucan branching enzyme GlgB n=1 Tax=Coralloluteibacterium stylophorae TaxID=1776034 RepID=A0A8J8AW56_9GAMM|nr:1,4-alpha-glucan branching protein GlgB [Coralloluteibacterium stylophorae]MBS7457328.1 1,4-alpha-glucan branching protein GlgB [Coralloluteibacterium stylophorae]
MSARLVPLSDATVRAFAEARHGDPFAVLGAHPGPDGRVLRVFLPGADGVVARLDDGTEVALGREGEAGFFAGVLPGDGGYRLAIQWPGALQETADAYAFGPQLGELDLHLITEGRHLHLADALGANALEVDGVAGTRFAVWAPNASRVAVVGDFNGWDARRHPMRLRHEAGVWELFVPGVGPGAHYKYALRGPHGEELPHKADPVARQAELAPGTASIVADPTAYAWRDEAWMQARAQRHAGQAPISVYEVHAGSWMHDAQGHPLDWDGLAERLIPYVVDMGFTHIELLPITEHPFGGSWGYQPLGLFAPTARFGTPDGFARFVDRCHREEIGVIVDWVPAHFPTDAHGLARFDGTALYEHADPREGFHRDWNTLIYNHGRHEVSGFLIASALEFLERYHVDGLRVDAVASMLYRDYSRNHGEWVPNIHGGRENYETIAFLRRLNQVVAERGRGAMTIAEESTAWPGVTADLAHGGLGFDYKWNMGWMHDSLHYIGREPVYRRHHHNELTFSMVYAYSERYMLPISHDEVVHGKRSLLGRMPGDEWQRFANLRAYLSFMFSHPGRKLLFMGAELAQPTEWNHDAQLPWWLLDHAPHRGIQRLVRDLNRIYTAHAALHALDDDPQGFQWLVGDDTANSVVAYLRRGPGGAAPVVVAINFTPVPREGYRIGVPQGGWWREFFNSDGGIYGGADIGNGGGVHAEDVQAHGQAHSLALTLPPLGAVMFAPG